MSYLTDVRVILPVLSICWLLVGILSVPRFDMETCEITLGINEFTSLKTFVSGKVRLFTL